ncbi:hypothetical protein FACS1894152_0100 [Bacilli bacterium]|nr:hypothetical protein FACS1894152_0100 [Bacilli bacterium]
MAGSIFWLVGLGELWEGLLSPVSVLDSHFFSFSFSFVVDKVEIIGSAIDVAATGGVDSRENGGVDGEDEGDGDGDDTNTGAIDGGGVFGATATGVDVAFGCCVTVATGTVVTNNDGGGGGKEEDSADADEE